MVTLSVELPLAPDEVRAVLEDEGAALEELRLEAIEGGTRVVLELRRDLDLLPEWVLSQVLRAGSEEAWADWLTDRRARKPSGREARETYADPLYHYPNFGAILVELALTPDDRLLEVGCGGGAFLRMALESGCRAAAIDHSPEMVGLAREQNAAAVGEGRLEVVEGDAASLPWADGTFTAAVLTGVLGFLPDPVAAFAEIRRVLAPGGRFVALGSPPEWKGTPAAPEPIASRLRFYTDDELKRLGREAGFEEARVERIELAPYAPEEIAEAFAGPGAPFLIARKK